MSTLLLLPLLFVVRCALLLLLLSGGNVFYFRCDAARAATFHSHCIVLIVFLFVLAHTHSENWRDDFSFGFLSFLLNFYILFFCTLALFTIFTIDYISLDTTFFVQVFFLYVSRWILNSEIVDMHWMDVNNTMTRVSEWEWERYAIGERTHVWKFNLHSFRFVDFLTFISICPELRIFPVIVRVGTMLSKAISWKFLLRYLKLHTYQFQHSGEIANFDIGFLLFIHEFILPFAWCDEGKTPKKKMNRNNRRFIDKQQTIFSSTTVINYYASESTSCVYFIILISTYIHIWACVWYLLQAHTCALY